MLLVISLVPVLFGLGLVIVALYPRVLEEARETIEGRWQLVALVFASGTMLDYLIVVIVEQLFTAFVIVAAIAVLSSVFVVARHGRAMADCSRLGIGPALLFAVGLSLLSLPILLEPLI